MKHQKPHNFNKCHLALTFDLKCIQNTQNIFKSMEVDHVHLKDRTFLHSGKPYKKESEMVATNIIANRKMSKIPSDIK